MKKMMISIGLMGLLFLSGTSNADAQTGEVNKPKPESDSILTEKNWHISWDQFLNAYQDCLNDQSCKLEQFHGQTFTWEGIFKGIRKTDKLGEVADVEMTPGSMIDRKGTRVEVINMLMLEPSDLEVWRKLVVGEKVRFRAKNMIGFGAVFIPLKSDCCFMVMFDGKAELVKGSSTPEK